MIRITKAEKIVFSFLFFCAVLVAARIGYANNIRYAFLLWNLFLAWIPFQLGLLLMTKTTCNKWIRHGIVLCWLLFFPNALYIITDLIHLENSAGKVPVWYDAILLFTSSVTGLMMAFISLHWVENYLERHVSKKHTGKLIFAALFLGSFGVYLGRFLRWNSWDIVANPVSLLYEVMARFTKPMLHLRTWGVTLLLTSLFSMLYFSLKKIPAYIRSEISSDTGE